MLMSTDAAGGMTTGNADLKRPRVESKDEILLVDAFYIYYPKVLHFFTYHIIDTDQAQDLTGEVFLKVAAAWPGFNPSVASLSTWIFAIARNHLVDYWRKKKYVQVELRDIPDDNDLCERIEKEESKMRLRKALLTLSDREREVLSFKYGSELKNTEIAAITGLSAAHVGILLFRALGKLKKEMRAAGGE